MISHVEKQQGITHTLPRPSSRSASCHVAFALSETEVSPFICFAGDVGSKPFKEGMPVNDGRWERIGLRSEL